MQQGCKSVLVLSSLLQEGGLHLWLQEALPKCLTVLSATAAEQLACVLPGGFVEGH